tara:strand:+ start:317 stop:976 length:660 start_codon:yes stop_codon:yes gene_type:complete
VASETADDADIDPSRLTLAQVLTVEGELGVPSDGTFKERAARASAVLKKTRAELKEENHGDISDHAAQRENMQKACATLFSLSKIGEMSGPQWRKRWRKLKKKRLDEEFTSMDDGQGWLVGILQCPTRKAAIGTSSGGARRATESGQDLHRRQALDEALKALKAADAQFAEWYATPPHAAPDPIQPQPAQRQHFCHALTSDAHAQEGSRPRACAHMGRG